MTQQIFESDEELWKRYDENRDQQAFGLLVRKHRERLMAFLIRFTRDADDSMDLLQETFKRFAQHYDGKRSSARTFLYCIAVNLARSHYRRVKNRREISLNDLEEEGVSLAGKNDYYREEMRMKLLQRALNQLRIQDREAIELKDVEGLTYRSAAQIIGCSEKRFEKKLSSARKRLMKIIMQNKEYEMLWREHARILENA
ncbi:MAG: RNA polymerase sigma factor [Candidatus Omnitrophica bacterium]|nr:RNA polymerase sigma factor [Candidatus Omnitrophota bacterium]